MFEKKFYNLYFYRELGKLNSLLDIFEVLTRHGVRTDICWDETRNEWKLTIGGTAYFEWEVKASWWMIDKSISLVERFES